MLRPTATHVHSIENYEIVIEFDSGETKVFDVKPFIKGQWYQELADKAYFSSVFANGYTVEWPHGQDLCPDEIYFSSRPLES
ncbi:MAG: DUF2442 domain-containing protein [Firmicutes bacterium]|nr:DUF2442 domain-containing protein [Bacillota bacterium]NBI64901.1 DUF2442 domain-containing protein [Clostridiales bacterium]